MSMRGRSMQILKRLHRNDDGASAVEYGLLVAAIAGVIVLMVFLLGGIVKNAFSDTCGAISAGSSANSASSCG
jgi:pilus assembly protein Flp/PilA